MTYRITVRGLLGPAMLRRIGQVVAIGPISVADGCTSFEIEAADQADLYGVLVVLQRYGVGLQSIVEVPAPG